MSFCVFIFFILFIIVPKHLTTSFNFLLNYDIILINFVQPYIKKLLQRTILVGFFSFLFTLSFLMFLFCGS